MKTLLNLTLAFFLFVSPASAERLGIWTTDDGKMAITTMHEDADEDRVMTKAAFEIRRRQTGDVTTHFDYDNPSHVSGISYSIIEDSALPDWANPRASTPKMRYENFRDAAEWDGSQVKVNMEKARVIQGERIERAKAKELEKLGKEFNQAQLLNDPSEQARIRGKRSVLDAPVDLSQAVTLEALRALWPQGLVDTNAPKE